MLFDRTKRKEIKTQIIIENSNDLNERKRERHPYKKKTHFSIFPKQQKKNKIKQISK